MTSNAPGASLNTVRDRARRTPVNRTRTRARVELPCELHDPDLWFADAPGDLERAKALCGDCPVQLACLIGAIERREPTGVWGGQLLDKGQIVSHKRPRGRPRKGSTMPQRHPFRPLAASVAHTAGHGEYSAGLLARHGLTQRPIGIPDARDRFGSSSPATTQDGRGPLAAAR